MMSFVVFDYWWEDWVRDSNYCLLQELRLMREWRSFIGSLSSDAKSRFEIPFQLVTVLHHELLLILILADTLSPLSTDGGSSSYSQPTMTRDENMTGSFCW
jgi:hypothetical protein